MLLQLRPIAGIVAIAAAIPLLTAGSTFSSMRTAALTLFVVASILWTALFYWLRTSTNAGRGMYVLCGLILGVLPSALFYIGAIVLIQPAPPVSMLIVGITTGALAGLALRDLSPFERKSG